MQTLAIDAYLLTGYGSYADGQLPPNNGTIRTYPCDGIEDAAPSFQGEMVPGGIQPLPFGVGSQIFVFGEHGQTLTISSAEIVRVSTGEKLPIYDIRTRSNDPNAFQFRNDSWGYVVPTTPYVGGESYTATIKGKSGLTEFTKVITFKARTSS